MKRIFSGIQPSGIIHIGNYVGAIRNWVKLLNEYESIFCIVDYHAMTVDYDPALMQERIFDAALVNIACGLDPGKCTLFVQSQVPEHTELTWIFNCVTPIGELERMTQFKMKAEQHRYNINMGLMDYPVLQSADILIYKAERVPVGEDQVQHIELAREVARHFNNRFGVLFPEPEALLSDTARILGLDGKSKMSKSMNNFIGILETPEEMWEKLRTATTDENRKRRRDPGDPFICNIHTIHTAFTPTEKVEELERGCRAADIGCIDCKRILWENMANHLAPIRERAAALRPRPDYIRDVLSQGAVHCREIAAAVMEETRRRVGIR